MKFYQFIFLKVILIVSFLSFSISVKTGLDLQLANRHKKIRNNYHATSENKYRKNNNEKNITKIVYPKKVNVYTPSLEGAGGIYWSGWVKYFHYDYDVDIKKPRSFYENPDYFTQKVSNKKYDYKDKDGHRKYIPGKNYFWAKLLSSNNFSILSSRKGEDTSSAHLIENLNTELIEYIIPDDNANGGVKDLGTFSEGSCFKVNIRIPSHMKDPTYSSRRTEEGSKQTWVICTDAEKSKTFLMSFFIAIKLKRQKEIGDEVQEIEPENAKSASELLSPKDGGMKIKRYEGPDASPNDGYLVLLQDWSDCSLKCGGGTQKQQWLCVPPKGKGKPCKGENILTRKCNEVPCPSTQFSNTLLKTNNDRNHVNLAPIYKALPFSTRPQQYVKCFIKENDVLYKTKEFDPKKQEATKVPARIIMNTSTIAVYKDATFNNALFTFNLAETVITKAKEDFCCFFLTSHNRQFELCGFNNNCGKASNPIWVTKWAYDFDYFQKKCYKELNEDSLNIPEMPPVLKSNLQAQPGLATKANKVTLTMPDNMYGNPQPIQPQMMQAQSELVKARTDIIETEIENTSKNENEKKVGQTQKTALTALRREINLEDMIKNEEVKKGQEENLELVHQFEQEKKKKKILVEALQQREKSFTQVRVAKTTEKEIKEIQEEAKQDIKFKRAVLKKKITEIRNNFKRKNRMIQQQINLIRSEMAEEIMSANKRGNSNYCKEYRSEIPKISQYCDLNFSTDLVKNQSCKDPTNFCYTCCENEFGNMYIAQRDDCQSMCDDLESKDLDNGDWVWSDGKKVK